MQKHTLSNKISRPSMKIDFKKTKLILKLWGFNTEFGSFFVKRDFNRLPQTLCIFHKYKGVLKTLWILNLQTEAKGAFDSFAYVIRECYSALMA